VRRIGNAAAAGLRNRRNWRIHRLMNKQDQNDAERRAESARILRGINAEMEPGGLAARVGDHFAGRDADRDDPVEIWGRRIGRGLSLVLTIVLIVWLVRFLV
jgi:hypothetical protein